MKNVSFSTMSHLGSISVNPGEEGVFVFEADKDNPLLNEMILQSPDKSYFQIHTPRVVFDNGVPSFPFQGMRIWQHKESGEAYPKATLVVVRDERTDRKVYKWQTHPNPITGEFKHLSYIQSPYWTKKFDGGDSIGFFMPDRKK